MDERITTVQQSLAAQKSFLNTTANKLKRGNAREFEYNQAQANLFAYQLKLKNLKIQRDHLNKQLLTFINQAHDKKLVISLPELPSHRPFDLKASLQQALQKRTDLKMAKLNFEQAELNKAIELGAHLPSLTLSAALSYQSNDSSALFEAMNKSDQVALSLSIPIFSGLSSVHARRALQNNVTALSLKKHSLVKSILVDVEMKVCQFNENIENYKLAKKWKTSAVKAHLGGISYFKKGIINNTQLVQLQSAREAAELGFIDSKNQLFTSYFEALHAMGMNLKEYL